ncbi:hypothetical protein M3201_15630 [Paenibacillus motobuensis]|uniref:hypothetical protein n=1 Tax=Paenibacillus TaxID=44249 RepID=UPI00203C34DB|nr:MULTISPECIES: hypothetical protein [Paenibacillus]MCM3041135.1 hypothetical protein [Paenibacillus lutimineralis]MCM3648239.1 hypothetical protein [Paenibacillus motobuensis]
MIEKRTKSSSFLRRKGCFSATTDNSRISNETGYRYLREKGLLEILTKLGIAIDANMGQKVSISPK